MNTATSSFPGSGMSATGGERLCGAGRTVDAIYMECGQMIGGSPIEQFIPDPTSPFDVVQFGVQAVGVHTFEDADGVVHALDWVGESHYQFPSDFIEEARVMGISRKIQEHQASQFSRASKLFLLHPRGHMVNHAQVGKDSLVVCPNGQHVPGDPCAGLHWVVPDNAPTAGHRMLSGSEYEVTPRVAGLPEAQYTHGIFLIVPITNLTLIARHDGTFHEQRLQAIKRSTLPHHVSPI